MTLHICEYCDYKTTKKSNYARHLECDRHKEKEKINKDKVKKMEINKYIKKNVFKCGYCDTLYQHQRSMRRHMNSCAYRSEYITKYNDSIKINAELELKI